MSHNEQQRHRCEQVEVENDEQASQLTVRAELPADAFAAYVERTLAQLAKDTDVDGFRPGTAPADVVRAHVGEDVLLQKAAQTAISEQYPLLLAEQALPFIGTPQVAVTTLAIDNPLRFTITAAYLPAITLPDYRTIAAEKVAQQETATVTDEEAEETLTHLRRERAKIEKMEAGTDQQQAAAEVEQMDTLSLPGIDDAFVQSLGYTDAEDFKTKLRENIQNEKQLREREKTRIAIIDAIIEGASIPVPEVLIEHELNTMERQFENDLAQAGTTLDAYVQQAGKSRDDLRGEWREGAEKRAKMQLILREISEKESIAPSGEDIAHQMSHLREHHKDAPEEAMREYVEMMLRNDMVFRWLEEAGGGAPEADNARGHDRA